MPWHVLGEMMAATVPTRNAFMTIAPSLASPQVIELRQYTLHPGRRDALIELFEREFIEPQEALGMRVIGTFRDLDAPDRFVWLRGFTDMASRAAALAAFYGGPVWQRHRDAANATMIDSDDVLLLRPARPPGGFGAADSARAPIGTPALPAGLITATLCSLAAPATDELTARFERDVRVHWTAAGSEPIACLVTETAANNFPRLPVREGEPMWVLLSPFADEAAQRRHAARLAANREWTGTVWPAWRERFAADPQTLRLAPTARSALHG
jgi:hypothetical protein